MKRNTFYRYLRGHIHDVWTVFVLELNRIFHDSGVMLIFFVAGLAYPVLYNLIYLPNVLVEVPVAVVDRCGSPESRDFIFRWDATQEVKVVYSCVSMQEAEQLLKDQKVHGILYIPADYSSILHTGLETAHLSLYCDMSSLLYMKNTYMAANMVMLDKMQNVQIDRYEAINIGSEMSRALVQGVKYESVALFNPTGGYGSFLIPLILVLIIHQTLFFGICMLCGTAREQNSEVFLLPGRRRRSSVYRLLIGRSAAYFVLYMAISVIDLLLIPRIFHLPTLANPFDVLMFLVPFLLATIFFSIFFGSFQKERETGMVTMLFTSLIFLFISGVSWLKEDMDSIWVSIGRLLPSTWGMHGYVHMQSMGASLATTSQEYYALWVLAVVYFILCAISLSIRAHIYNADLREEDRQRTQRLRQMLHERQVQLKEKTEHYYERHFSARRHQQSETTDL